MHLLTYTRTPHTNGFWLDIVAYTCNSSHPYNNHTQTCAWAQRYTHRHGLARHGGTQPWSIPSQRIAELGSWPLPTWRSPLSRLQKPSIVKHISWRFLNFHVESITGTQTLPCEWIFYGWKQKNSYSFQERGAIFNLWYQVVFLNSDLKRYYPETGIGQTGCEFSSNLTSSTNQEAFSKSLNLDRLLCSLPVIWEYKHLCSIVTITNGYIVCVCVCTC